MMAFSLLSTFTFVVKYCFPCIDEGSCFDFQKKLIIELVKIQNDGTVEVDIDESAPVASELLELHSVEEASFYINDSTSGSNKSIPRLKITMLVVGTRGDVQPFVAMAKRLQACVQ